MEQLDEAPLPFPPERVHVACGENAPLPLGLSVQLTVPVGDVCELPVSVTVTVHVAEVPAVSVLEVQVGVVLVVRSTETE